MRTSVLAFTGLSRDGKIRKDYDLFREKSGWPSKNAAKQGLFKAVEFHGINNFSEGLIYSEYLSGQCQAMASFSVN